MSKEEQVIWVLEFEGDEFDIELCPDGLAYATINASSRSQAMGKGEEGLLNQMFPPPGFVTTGKFIKGRYPMIIPQPLKKKMRQVIKIEDAKDNIAARDLIDDALLALFVTQVVPRMRRVE